MTWRPVFEAALRFEVPVRPPCGNGTEISKSAAVVRYDRYRPKSRALLAYSPGCCNVKNAKTRVAPVASLGSLAPLSRPDPAPLNQAQALPFCSSMIFSIKPVSICAHATLRVLIILAAVKVS
jgi:hypothetical protein